MIKKKKKDKEAILYKTTGVLKGIFPDFKIIFLCHELVDIPIRIFNPKF